MTNTYNTGNLLGSTDPRDLYDNASNFDEGMNAESPAFTDRLGVMRKSWNGMETEFSLAQSGRDAEFQQFLTDSGFVSLGNYAAGINFTAYNQYMARDGLFYRPAPSSIPFTTTGTWVGGDENLFNLFSPDDVLRQDLATAGGSALVEYGGATVKSALDAAIGKLGDFPITQDNGAVVDGVTDDSAAIQTTYNASSAELTDGTYALASGLVLTSPGKLSGKGARTKLQATAAFPASPIITLSPTVGSDPKDWIIKDLLIANAGAATNVFMLDIATAGKYISKLQFSGIISQDQTSAPFVELLNPVNVDGLFTSVFEDNWSFGGYYLDNVGDSVVLQRNTVTGAGLGYYVNQLATASHIIIRDGNNTSSGGALGVAFGFNITFDNMQVECPLAFTGANDAAVWANNDGSALVTNLRITNSNINTQNNVTNCVYLNHTDGAVIDGCSLFCHPTLGQHITLDTDARNTYIGNNKYFSSVDGTEIAPRIVDTGPGTQGVVRAATLATWTSLVDPVNGFPAGFTKSRDGLVTLRGNLTGAASTAGQTLYTLPIGFRPSAKVHVFAAHASGAASQQALVQVLPTGEVQFITTGATTVYLDGMSFSTKP